MVAPIAIPHVAASSEAVLGSGAFAPASLSDAHVWIDHTLVQGGMQPPHAPRAPKAPVTPLEGPCPCAVCPCPQ